MDARRPETSPTASPRWRVTTFLCPLSFSLVKESLREFQRNRPMELAAALSYYTLLSLAPLVLVVVSIATLAFRREAVEGKIVLEMRGLVGEAGAEVIQTVLRNVSSPETGAFALITGIVTLFIGATTVFVQLHDALNRIWNVESQLKESAPLTFLRERILSLTMVVGTGFLLLVSLVVSAGLSAFGDWAGESMGGWPTILQITNVVVSLAVVSLLFAMIFKYLPDVRIPWHTVWFGALTTSALFTVGKHLIGLYLGRAGVGSAYGAAGSLVVLMAWVYYASLIVLFGAQLTRVCARHESELASSELRAA